MSAPLLLPLVALLFEPSEPGVSDAPAPAADAPTDVAPPKEDVAPAPGGEPGEGDALGPGPANPEPSGGSPRPDPGGVAPSAGNKEKGGTAATAAPLDPSTQGDAAPEQSTDSADPAEEALSMDDIFGTPEDVELPTAAPSPATPSPRPSGSGRMTSLRSKFDTSFRVVSSAYYDIARADERAFSRNENRIEFTFRYTPNEHIQIVGNVEPVFLGVSQARELDDLATRQLLAPFHVESDAAYVAINDLVPKLDIKVGRQIVVWGTADKFNPTNNINPDDLEDRPLFTEPIANQMVVVDYAPLDDKLWFQGVYVPLFYPALLPPSAAAGLKDPSSPVPFANDADVTKVEQLQRTLELNPSLVPTVVGRVSMPRRRFSDGQSAIKLGTTLGGVDASISYYNGRHDIPSALRVDSSTKDPVEGSPDEEECCFRSDVVLNYPRMQVLGLDFSTQLGFSTIWGCGAKGLCSSLEPRTSTSSSLSRWT